MARAKQAIGEAQQQILALRSERAERPRTSSRPPAASSRQAQQKLAAAADKLARITITAPVAGTVVELKLKTLGGVVGAGDPLLDLVPLDDTLVLEARVAPIDIDEVHAGLRAQVHLLAYKSRNLPRIEGTGARGLGRPARRHADRRALLQGPDRRARHSPSTGA